MSRYGELLKDPRWQRKRLEVFERDHWRCTQCGAAHRPLHVHHSRYVGSAPWETPSEFLRTLCEDCHAAEHDVDGAQAEAAGQASPPREVGAQAEREVVRILVHRHGYVDAVSERIGEEMFEDPVYRSIYREIVNLRAYDSVHYIFQVASGLDQAAAGVLDELAPDRQGVDRAEEILDACVRSLLAREIARQLAGIDRVMPLVSTADKDSLMREKKRLSVTLQGLGTPPWKSMRANVP